MPFNSSLHNNSSEDGPVNKLKSEFFQMIAAAVSLSFPQTSFAEAASIQTVGPVIHLAENPDVFARGFVRIARK